MGSFGHLFRHKRPESFRRSCGHNDSAPCSSGGQELGDGTRDVVEGRFPLLGVHTSLGAEGPCRGWSNLRASGGTWPMVDFEIGLVCTSCRNKLGYLRASMC